MFATESNRAPARARLKGMSIIEVMLGIVISLLIGLAAAGSATVFTASQRQGVGVGGASINAATALAALKNDAAAAGLGFFGDSKYLCNQLNLSLDGTVFSDGANFTPVLITAGTSADQIDVVSATQIAAGTNVLLNAASNGDSADLRSLLPVSVGNGVLLAPITPGVPCTVRSVTANVDATATTAQKLTFGNTGHYNGATFTTSVTYPDKGRITLLGDLHWSRYRLSGTSLMLERPLLGDSALLIRNVVAFRAQYGLATAVGATTLAGWQNASGAGFAPLTAANLPRVRALQIGLVTRSPQREKEPAGASAGECEATTAMPTLFGSAVTADVSDWKCYRYRTAIVVVPLRNLVNGVAAP
jgi:type IV pilus assembly protein PilW